MVDLTDKRAPGAKSGTLSRTDRSPVSESAGGSEVGASVTRGMPQGNIFVLETPLNLCEILER